MIAAIQILLVHFLADFALQTHEQATNKAKSNKALFAHVGTYSLCWILGSYVILENWSDAFAFASLTFLSHFAIDYVTSRLSGYHFQKQDFHNGFVVVGADQVLHYLQLYFTFYLLAR